MNYEESIEYLKRKSYSAYEICKSTGLTEAGLRKLLKGEIIKPQRKTKEAIIDYVNQLGELSDINESDFNTLDVKKMNMDIIAQQRKILGLSWDYLAEGLPIAGNSLRTAFNRRAVGEVYLKHVTCVIDDYKKKQVSTDIAKFGEDIVLESYASDVMKNHEKLLLSQNYKNWFELQVYKKALEVVSNNKT
jgi:hypothetical protein